jgi:hypothetical protein
LIKKGAKYIAIAAWLLKLIRPVVRIKSFAIKLAIDLTQPLIP